MLEILNSCWVLIVGLLSSLWTVLSLVASWGWEVLYHLHVSAPRLEGLLVGIGLAWLMMRRDRHPLLRVLSSPLKLVVDILDLGWDQAIEVCGDLWSTARSWVVGSAGWIRGRVASVYDRVMSGLRSVRDRLSRSKE